MMDRLCAVVNKATERCDEDTVNWSHGQPEPRMSEYVVTAILRELREPSEEMWAAYLKANGYNVEPGQKASDIVGKTPQTGFAAMIDAILEETEE